MTKTEKAQIAIILIIFLFLIIVSKFPLLPLAIVAVLIVHHPTIRLKRASKKPSISQKIYLNIDGVPGKVEMVTNPLDLEAGRALSFKEIKALEAQVLHCSPGVWREEGEKVALNEESLGQAWVDQEAKRSRTAEYGRNPYAEAVMQAATSVLGLGASVEPAEEMTTPSFEQPLKVFPAPHYSPGGIVLGPGATIVPRPGVSYGGGVK